MTCAVMGPPPPNRTFWLQVEQQVAAGLILSMVAGIGYLVWSVPRQLDLVLQNQRQISERAAAIEARMTNIDGQIDGLDRRVTRLESRR